MKPLPKSLMATHWGGHAGGRKYLGLSKTRREKELVGNIRENAQCPQSRGYSLWEE